MLKAGANVDEKHLEDVKRFLKEDNIQFINTGISEKGRPIYREMRANGKPYKTFQEYKKGYAKKKLREILNFCLFKKSDPDKVPYVMQDIVSSGKIYRSLDKKYQENIKKAIKLPENFSKQIEKYADKNSFNPASAKIQKLFEIAPQHCLANKDIKEKAPNEIPEDDKPSRLVM
jgi:hypothetical protein